MWAVIFMATAELGGRDGTGYAETPQSSLFLPRICKAGWGLNTHSLGCYKPLVNFLRSKKVDSDSVCLFSVFLWKNEIWNLFLHHFVC